MAGEKLLMADRAGEGCGVGKASSSGGREKHENQAVMRGITKVYVLGRDDTER